MAILQKCVDFASCSIVSTILLVCSFSNRSLFVYTVLLINIKEQFNKWLSLHTLTPHTMLDAYLEKIAANPGEQKCMGRSMRNMV
jgi:hypothetical protein